MSKLNRKLSQVALAVGLTFGVSGYALADSTSSSMRGVVTGPNGSPAIGTQVTVTHVPTGSVRSGIVNENGIFTFKGLRVGGPYKVEFDSDNLADQTVTDVFIKLGEEYGLDLALAESSVETIVVTARQTNLNFDSNGASASFGFDDLQNAPSVTRDIKDVIAQDPRIMIDETNSNAIQCAGSNNRYNSLTVDGIRMNDNFGLNNNGYPTERLPFPFDAIDQVAVEISPFDVTYGGFSGCAINAVTRSGSNEIEGSVFVDFTNDKMQGNSIEGNEFDVPKFNEYRYGLTFGAPIIEDTLFAFFAYEEHTPSEIVEYGPEGAGFSNEHVGLSVADVQRISNAARDVYGYETGPLVNSFDEEEKKFLFKLDWEINEDHRAQMTYQHTNGNNISTTDNNSRGFAFSDHFYERSNKMDSVAVQLFSDWSSDFSTEVRVASSKIDNGQKPLTSRPDFGEFKIEDVNGYDIHMGPDQYRHANKLKYDTLTFKVAGTYLVGDHQITAGFEGEQNDFFNLFVHSSEGLFTFASLEDFENGIASDITYRNAPSLNANDAAASFSLANYSLYVQDAWSVNSDLTLTFGLRWDKWQSDDKPTHNPKFETRYGFSNAIAPNFDLIQPRVGFNWSADETMMVYGGLGLFSGGNPNVWISNNYSNNGVAILGSNFEGDTQEELDALNAANTTNFGYEVPALSTDPRYFTGGDGEVNTIDPNFKAPGLWKFNLGVQKEWDGGYFTGADVIVTKENNPAIVQDLRLQATGTAPDGRPTYTNCATDVDNPSGACVKRSNPDYMLTNSNDSGQSFVGTLFAEKRFESGFNARAGYTYQNMQEVHPMTSSTAGSNFGNLSTLDINNPTVGTSNYETPHRFTLKLSYSHEFFDGYETRFSMFGQRVKGRAYSYNFDWDPGFGDTVPWEDRNLLYVPSGPGATDDPNVIYDADFDLDGFNQLIAEQGMTRGQIQERNAFNSDWWSRVDLNVRQEFKGFTPEHRASIFFNIYNLGNMLNDDWGVRRQVNFEYNNPVVDAYINDQGQYVFTNFDGDNPQTIRTNSSVWQIRVGVDYKF
ncbi:TonB-dependent receptor [Paraferrimonas sp. SM1919]|uniref:TonB-dependent receptor n=1 Tax=Paraferrimonas sp. SM1919 TaxID=2662263 RepID=UPI0013D4AED8|nr:TonB-dependent receptor [Paraferrimonas sp. SM1919]